MTVPRFRRHHLITPDVQAAREFYGELFGWSFEDREGVVAVLAGPREIGTIRSSGGDDEAPHWIGSVAVADVEAVARAAEEHGGHVERGDLTTIADPLGALVSAFAPDDDGNERPLTGAFSWAEVFTPDPDGTAAFYDAVFGWKTRRLDLGPAGAYRIFTIGEAEPAGIVQIPENAPHPPHWLPYVLVEHVEQSAAHVGELGGFVLIPPTALPHVGRFAVCGDPQGALFALFRKETEAEAEARLAARKGFRAAGEATA